MTTVSIQDNGTTLTVDTKKVDIVTVGIQGPMGGGGVVYSNVNATPFTVGGIAAGTTFSNVPLAEMWNKLLYPYQAPSISLGASPSSGVREFGTSVSNVLLTAHPTERTNPITSYKFYKDNVLLQDSMLLTYQDTGIVNTTTTYKLTITDGTSTVSSTKIFTYVYPFYWGVGAKGLTAAQVAGLTQSTTTRGTKTVTTSPTFEVFYFAYPASYGQLTSILDPTDFEVIADYLVRSENIVGLDGNAVPYYIYEFVNYTTQVGFTLRYYF